jgi:hypothetical protein
MLAYARTATGKRITATIIEGLEELEKRSHRSAWARAAGQDPDRSGRGGNTSMILIGRRFVGQIMRTASWRHSTSPLLGLDDHLGMTSTKLLDRFLERGSAFHHFTRLTWP